MRILIVGAGSQGAVVADALLLARAAGSPLVPIGFLDDTRGGHVLDLPVLGRLDALAAIEHDGLIVAVGDNAARRAVTDRLVEAGETVATAIHPFTSVAREVDVGEGSMLCAGAIVSPRSTIGRGVLLNTKSSVDHDCVIGAFAHVSPGATVGGKCFIGEEAMIGLGACVLSGVRVGARTVVGAGSVVVRDLPDDVVAYGVPARVVRARQ